jgi:hypothetical protein
MTTPLPAATTTGPQLTSADVWREVQKHSDAVLGHVTSAGKPRTSGVVYQAVDRRIYVAVGPDSWKARQIATGDEVSITVLVRRGGLLVLAFPIPPATITCHGTATLLQPGSAEARAIVPKLAKLLPPTRPDGLTIIQIEPVGRFLTYGIGIKLKAMRDPAAARAHVPVG